MGILLTPNTTLIKVHGTDIELSSVYARIEFNALPDGTTISVNYKIYIDHSYFLINEELFTDIHIQQMDFTILATETQSIDIALAYTAQRFVEMGYLAEILILV